MVGRLCGQGDGGMQQQSVLHTRFRCEPQKTLKNKVYLKKKKKKEGVVNS